MNNNLFDLVETPAEIYFSPEKQEQVKPLSLIIS